MAATDRWPITGKAKRRKVEIHSARCLALPQRGAVVGVKLLGALPEGRQLGAVGTRSRAAALRTSIGSMPRASCCAPLLPTRAPRQGYAAGAAKTHRPDRAVALPVKGESRGAALADLKIEAATVSVAPALVVFPAHESSRQFVPSPCHDGSLVLSLFEAVYSWDSLGTLARQMSRIAAKNGLCGYWWVSVGGGGGGIPLRLRLSPEDAPRWAGHCQYGVIPTDGQGIF